MTFNWAVRGFYRPTPTVTLGHGVLRYRPKFSTNLVDLGVFVLSEFLKYILFGNKNMSRGQRKNSSNKTFPAKYRYWSTTATCISVKATIFWNKILKLNYQFFENLQEQEKNCIQVSCGEVPLYVNKTFFWKYKSLNACFRHRVKEEKVQSSA